MMNAHGRIVDTMTQNLESKLFETIQRYELVFRATNDVLYELDLVGGTMMWNETLYREYGFERNEDTQRLEWWTTRVHPDDALRVEHELSEWLASDRDTWQSEYRFQIADGTYINVRDRAVLLRLDDGTPQRIIGSFQDVTRKRQLEHAKDEFISLVSHQLRTPLTAVRIYSDMLASGMFGELNDDQLKYATHISEASVRLIKQVEDIVHISRVELDQTHSRPRPVDINELIRQCIDETNEYAHKKKVTVNFTPNHKINKISIDPGIFRRVVAHLMTNALHYSEPEKGHVDVGLKETERVYLFTVKDNGIGIPESVQPHIFTRFYRGENTENIEQEGTGLGLYMVEQLAKIAGYSIRFESKKGKGSIFYVEIPKSDAKK